MASHEDYNDICNAPILTSDVASMFRRRILKNDRPYVANTTKLNNRMVDDWKKTVLDKISDHRGLVPSERVWRSWQLYNEGKTILKYQELRTKGVIPEISEEVFEFWKDFFEILTIEEMHAYGSGTVSHGWGIIQNCYKMWYANQKYEKLFSQYSTPLEWEKNYHHHKPLLFGEIFPFWDKEILKDIQQKVSAILMNQVNPH